MFIGWRVLNFFYSTRNFNDLRQIFWNAVQLQAANGFLRNDWRRKKRRSNCALLSFSAEPSYLIYSIKKLLLNAFFDSKNIPFIIIFFLSYTRYYVSIGYAFQSTKIYEALPVVASRVEWPNALNEQFSECKQGSLR